MMWDTECADCTKWNMTIGDQSFVIDSDGYPHIAYVGDQVYYARFDGTVWQVEIIDDPPGTIYDFTQGPASIVLDEDDNPHISYLNVDSTSILYAYNTGSGWISEMVETAAPGNRIWYDTAIALDQSGKPHLCFSNEGVLRYAKWTGASWQIETVDDSAWFEMYYSLVLDSSDHAHISYFAADQFNPGFLKYAYWNGSYWEKSEVDRNDAAGYLGEFNSIALDSSGTPHISYLEYEKGKLNHAILTSSGWDIQSVDTARWWGGFTSIKIDSSDNSHISYTDRDDPRYAYWSGSAWITETLDSRAWYTAIALDNSDDPHIAYFNLNTRYIDHAKPAAADWEKDSIDSVNKVG